MDWIFLSNVWSFRIFLYCLLPEFVSLDIYYVDVILARPLGTGNVDSARQNLAASFVNGLVNAGFGQDKLLMEDGNKWLYKNKEHGRC